MSSRKNPYSTAHAWDEATQRAYTSMPLVNGHAIALPFLEQRFALQMEGLWRDWCKSTPRHLWPLWLDNWADTKRRRGWE
jgi:hypothetical protein